MWVHVHRTHSEGKKQLPVNAAGCTTKGTDDLPVVQSIQRKGNELRIISAPARKQSSSLESVIQCSLVTFGTSF